MLNRNLFSCVFVIFLCMGTGHAQIITTIAGNGTAGYSGDGGRAFYASLNYPMCLIVDSVGNIFFSDELNDAVRKIDTLGYITTIAGTGTAGFAGDGGPATDAILNKPRGLALDRTGCLLIADRGNNRIRKIQKNGIITTIAGGGTDAWAENVLATTVSVTAGGLLVDSLNNIFIADVGRGRVRVISSSGYIVTIAGTGTMGYSGDGGPATAAKLGSPDFLLFDSEGNLLLADNENDRIRKIDKLGIITTFAGSGTSAFAGDGGPATAASLKTNGGMLLDSWGNILFADAGNRRIRSISSAGIIQTIAGGGTAAPYFGDGGPALGCGLNYPTDIALTKDGAILVADRNNHRIRKISSNVGVKDMVLNTQLVVFPNPCTTYFEIMGAEAFAGATLGLFDLDGRQVLEQIWQKGDKVTLPEHLQEGLYVVSLVLPGKSIVGVIEKGINKIR